MEEFKVTMHIKALRHAVSKWVKIWLLHRWACSIPLENGASSRGGNHAAPSLFDRKLDPKIRFTFISHAADGWDASHGSPDDAHVRLHGPWPGPSHRGHIHAPRCWCSGQFLSNKYGCEKIPEAEFDRATRLLKVEGVNEWRVLHVHSI